MKRVLNIAFSILMVCSLLLLIIVGIAKAGNATYSMTEYQWVAASTIDGKWTTNDEWTDGPPMTMGPGNATFTYKMDMTSYTMQWLVEIFTDNTNDTGDYWQICLDPDNSGGTAPQTGDFKIEIQGHTTLTVYGGTGSGWTVISQTAGELTWANSISASPWNSTAHWILEIQDNDKTTGTIITPAPPNGMRVAAYDANTSTLAAWAPNSNANVPNEYGVISTYSTTPIPEGFSLGVVVLLSSVAVVVSFYFLRKRPKTESSRIGKTGEINYTS
jgi:hypothetical protein